MANEEDELLLPHCNTPKRQNFLDNLEILKLSIQPFLRSIYQKDTPKDTQPTTGKIAELLICNQASPQENKKLRTDPLAPQYLSMQRSSLGLSHLQKKVHCIVSRNTINFFYYSKFKKKSLKGSHISVALLGSSASICEILPYYLIKHLSKCLTIKLASTLLTWWNLSQIQLYLTNERYMR